MPTYTRRDLMLMEARRIAIAHDVSLTAVLGKSRLRMFVLPRQEIAYTLRNMNFSWKRIAAFLRRDHKSVIHGYRKHAMKLGVQPNGTGLIDLPGRQTERSEAIAAGLAHTSYSSPPPS